MTEKKEASKEVQNAIEILGKQGITMPKNMADTVMNTLALYEQQGSVNLPPNYSVGNAMKSAWLKFQADQKLMSCEPSTIANALLDMAIMGLNPSKNQCYFVPMGNKCTLMPSYFGKQTAVKRIKGVLDVRSDVIYKDTGYELLLDEFGNDEIKITSPCPLEKRCGANIIGAWARVILDEKVWGTTSYVTILTIEEIRNAFNMGNAKGNSPAHKNFLGEMAKRTAINRCIKNFINTRDDQDILIEVINRSTSNEYEEFDKPKGPSIQEAVFEEIDNKQATKRVSADFVTEEQIPIDTQNNAQTEPIKATEGAGVGW